MLKQLFEEHSGAIKVMAVTLALVALVFILFNGGADSAVGKLFTNLLNEFSTKAGQSIGLH